MGKRKKLDGDAIAVVGMGCVLPGAHSPEELWCNVLAGRRFFRETPSERLPMEDYHDPDPTAPGKTYSRQMAVVSGWEFDPLAYRIPPISFKTSDLAHWLALHTAKLAVEDSKLDLEDIDRGRVGVILGNSLAGEFSRSHYLRFRWPYVERSLRKVMERDGVAHASVDAFINDVKDYYNGPLPEINEDSLAGNMSNTIAGRICNYFDLGACGYTVDGACSSSLLSVATACNALVSGDMDMVFTGGVDISLDPFEIIGFAKTKALAEDDIRPYDENAAGMLTGEGCGIVMLTRVSEAERLGLKIHALVRGWGYSSDGSGGITAPEVKGQVRALENAYRRADYPMSSLGLIEGHGTGTTLGDNVELSAIKEVRAQGDPDSICHIGSLKGNIGHCKAAAGVAGMIKAVMALERKVLPPTLNCIKPNQVFGRPMEALRPSIGGGEWKPGKEPRRAAVSAMGFGGSNSHITLEEANPEVSATAEDLKLLRSQRNSELIVLSAPNIDDLIKRIDGLIPVVARICRAELTDLAAELSKEPVAGDCRLAIVARSPWELRDVLERISRKLADTGDLGACDEPGAGVFAALKLKNPSCAALFPGQGSQYLNMGSDYYKAYSSVEDFYASVEKDIAGLLPDSLKDSIFRDQFSGTEEDFVSWRRELAQTRISQAAITLTSMSIARLLEFFGIKPDYRLGHSLGEISALASGGAMTPAMAVKVATLRGGAMGDLKLKDPGAMLALVADGATAEDIVKSAKLKLTVANYNSPRQTVVSGATSEIDKLSKICKEKGVRSTKLRVSNAFHSDLVAPAAAKFAKELAGIKFKALSGKVVSSSTGDLLESDVDLKKLLSDHIKSSVKFVDAVAKVAELKPTLYLEFGPGAVLCGLTRNILGNDTECMPLARDNENDCDQLHRVLGRLFSYGFPVEIDKLFEDRFSRPINAENYEPVFIVNPCERPVELPTASTTASSLPATMFGNDMKGPDFENYLNERGAFLREMISLDYRHHQSSESAPSEYSPKSSAPEKAPPKPELETNENMDLGDVMTFAVDWISQRTGYPKSSILPEMKLRDDLNLDSIKVGELVLMVCKKLNKQSPADTSVFANVRLDKMIEVIFADFSSDESESSSVSSQAVIDDSAPSLGEWVRSFQMERLAWPLSMEKELYLPKQGSMLLIGKPDWPWIKGLRKRFESKGLNPVVVDIADVIENRFPSDLKASEIAMVVLVIPQTEKYFTDMNPAAFDQELAINSESLYHLFRWLGRDRDASWKNLRCVVVRASGVDDKHNYIDAGKAFLKTMRLEHSAAQLKWLTLPAKWPVGMVMETVEKEIRTTGERVVFHYGRKGERFTEAGNVIPVPSGKPLTLNGEDVALITGGAKGITYELARELALKTGVKLALLGTSSAPEMGDEVADSELYANLRALKRANIKYRYYQCDVTDLKSLRNCVKKAEKALGPVTMLVHGAGISQLTLLDDLKLETYRRVIEVKAKGFYNLLRILKPADLKALHVISSVLGKTGMRGQADYTFANSWIDGALESIHADYPKMHCVSVGYSVWSETGLGKKLGAVASLSASGVTPMDNKTGIDSYMKLLAQHHKPSTFVVTGQLGPELENKLFVPFPGSNQRFLRKILRWAPGTELVSESVLSHHTDLYLPEHIFEGTPIVPAVMALESMVEAAMVCIGTDDLPVLRNLEFNRPIIVPVDSRVVIRVFALVEPGEGDTLTATLALRSNQDGFQEDYFHVTAVFNGGELEDKFPTCPSIKSDLDIDPDDLWPSPLFQGKFLRRITAIKKMEIEEESVTTVRIPDGDKYFSQEHSQRLRMPSPAARDAFLQSGLLIIPAGSLPARIDELRIVRTPAPGELLTVYSKVLDSKADERVSDIYVYDSKKRPVELIRRLETKVPDGMTPPKKSSKPSVATEKRMAEELDSLIGDAKFALSILPQADTKKSLDAFVASDEVKKTMKSVSKARQSAALGGLAATGQAAARFLKKYLKTELKPGDFRLTHTKAGKPGLEFADDFAYKSDFEGLDVSMSDGLDLSISFLSRAPVGVDVELVEKRDSETWRGLLSEDGYALALSLVNELGEGFDLAATRVWTLIEAGKKANELKRVLPSFGDSIGGSWLEFTYETDGMVQEYLSAVFSPESSKNELAVLTVALRSSREPTGQSGKSVVLTQDIRKQFDNTLEAFKEKMREFKPRFLEDPEGSDTEDHYQEFLVVVDKMMEDLISIQEKVEPDALYELRQTLSNDMLEFLDGSEVFRHAIVKPYGYAGDFELLDKLVQLESEGRGLAYHFDRSQLEYPASVACRNRIEWVGEELIAMIKKRKIKTLKVLDIGIGAAPIERYVTKALPDLGLRLTAVDIEPACLEFVKNALQNEHRSIDVHRIDLRREDAPDKLRAFAADVDVCIAVGIIEALRDEEMVRVLGALFDTLPKGTPFYTESFLPNHPNRPHMEWFMDFHLGYRSRDRVIELVKEAGAEESRMTASIDETKSLGFLKVVV